VKPKKEPEEAPKPRKPAARKPAAKKAVTQRPEPKGKDGKRSLVPQLPRKN
jgi:ATP-dependent Clp protease ATP-binding subunit ClpA